MRNKTYLEPAKTVLLNILIVTSLILSWMLWNPQPNYEYIHPSQYVDPQPAGYQKKVSDLVKPSSIVFHYGNDTHTRALPDLVHFGYVAQEIQKWYIYDFIRISLSDEQWEQLLNESKGIEIIYPDEVPFSVIEQQYTLRGNPQGEMQSLNKIWVYENQEESLIEVLMISEKDQLVLRARTGVTPSELENVLSLGNVLSSQIAITGTGSVQDSPFFRVFYVPEERVQMRQFRYFYQPITPDQMVRVLFVDPSITRRITERDGTIIYTDGSRGVQISPDRRTIIYQDPVLQAVEEQQNPPDLSEVIEFVNRNGGWMGQFLLEKMIPLANPEMGEQETALAATQNDMIFRFRQYEGSYPIIGGSQEEYGRIELKSQGAYITEFQRPLFQIDRFINYETVALLSGKEVWERMPELGIEQEDVLNMYLAYRMEIGNDYLDLVPVWAVETIDSETPLLFEARADGVPEEVGTETEDGSDDAVEGDEPQDEGDSAGTPDGNTDSDQINDGERQREGS